jgi:hypothetical protein
MANVSKNVLTRGVSGKVGNLLVFRKRGDQTIMSAAPGKRTLPLTAAQLLHQEKFREAVFYAKAILQDPQKKEAYKESAKNGESAFNLAVSDFFRLPDIREIDLSRFTGQAGDLIRVRVVDNFKLTGVDIGIYKADGSEVDSGPAEAEPNGLHWIYPIAVNHPSMTGGKVVATATDWPGHKVKMEKII